MYQNQPAQPYPNPYGFQAPPPVRRRWWQHPALIIAALVLLPPAGIALAWLSPWSGTKKIVATVLSGVWFLLAFLSDPPAEEKDDAKAKAAASASASASPSASASASPSPTPSADVVMPDVVGKAFSEAEAAVEALIDGELRAAGAYTDVSLPANPSTWIVCFQGPAAGARLVPADADANVHLVAPGTKCPARTGTELRPAPSKTPTPKPTPTPTAQPKPKPVRRTPAPTPTRDEPDNVYYENCTAVREAGADPIHRGEPGYGRHLDRDGDGVGCE
ncbi:excalibur calcium-binding domain-containing protein [Streptomyces sp. NPDC050848]|uniref:excalibur calcium-binding domain-containing protein n=1 Tax=Streptomyces sp. NPDC050848 TaxID=3155791 RepID=UPI0033DF93F1